MESSNENGPTREMIRTVCEVNDVKTLQQYVSEGVSVNSRVYSKVDYVPLLLCALFHNATDVATYLLAHPEIDIYRCLRAAVEHGTTEHVKFLVEHGADVDAKELDDSPLLSVPVTVDMAKYLISIGFDAKKASLGSQTSLETIKVLVDAGADTNTPDSLNYTPLMWYFDNDEWDLDIVDFFASRATNLNNGGNFGRSTLDKALSRAEDVSNGVEAVKILLKYGARPLFQEIVNVGEKPALFRTLLEGKADPNMKFTFPDGPTVTLTKALTGPDVDPEALEILKEFGATDE